MTDSEMMGPCPWCGGQPNQIRANGGTWNGGIKPPQPPVSWDVLHWCPRVEGQPSPRTIYRCGKTREDAITAWNTRAAAVETERVVEVLRAACDMIKEAAETGYYSITEYEGIRQVLASLSAPTLDEEAGR